MAHCSVRNSVFVLLTYFVVALCANSPCKQQGSCYCIFQNGSYINLADISLKGKSRFSQVPYIPAHYDPSSSTAAFFSYDPCTPFTETVSNAVTNDTEKPCKDVLACKLTPGHEDGGDAEIHAIAMPNHVLFQNLSGVITIFYDTPGASNLTVKLVCNPDIEHDLKIDVVDPFTQNMTLTSRCACLDQCSKPNPGEDPEEQHGLSTGSILLIVFFTLLAIYVFGGMTYNFCNGAHGVEMLPHSQFWNDLPQLIMDGFLFTCTCFSKQSQSSYSDL